MTIKANTKSPSYFTVRHPERVKREGISPYTLFCGECKETSLHCDYDDRDYATTLTCEHCGTEHELNGLDRIRSLSYQNPNIFLDMIKLWDNGDKVSISTIVREVTAWNDKLQFKTFKVRYTFNTKTGQSYQIINSIYGNFKGRGITNISYRKGINHDLCFVNCERNLLSEAKDLIYKKLQDNGYYPLPRTDKYSVDLSELILLNRFPQFDQEHIFDMLNIENIDEPAVRHPIKDIKNTQGPDDYFKLIGLKPTKSIRKELLENMSASMLVKGASNVFKKPDNILKLLKHDASTKNNQIYVNHSRGFNEVLKGMLRANGNDETIVVNKLVKVRDAYLLGDTVRMYDRFFTDAPELLSQINYQDDLVDIHDSLSAEWSKFQSRNQPIPTTKKEKELESTLNGYTFTLAKDTHELIDIGTRMHICVGSYGDYAVQKTCTIISAKSSDTEICIELRQGSVVQAKLKYNQIPQGNERTTVIQWAKLNGLAIATSDLTREEKPVQRVAERPNLYGDYEEIPF